MNQSITNCITRLKVLQSRTSLLIPAEERIIQQELETIENSLDNIFRMLDSKILDQVPQQGLSDLDKFRQLHRTTKFKVVSHDIHFQQHKKILNCDRCKSPLLKSKQDLEIIELPCKHTFHLDCIYKQTKCLSCQKDCALVIGDQPDGEMVIKLIDDCCEGFNCNTIQIEYHIGSTIKKGVIIPETYRKAYLPNNTDGQQIIELLKQAFDQRLIFTIGKSMTTGLDNQIIWADIPHKTQLTFSQFGYPDIDYFEDVRQALQKKGIS